MVDDFGVEVLQLMEVAGQAVAAWDSRALPRGRCAGENGARAGRERWRQVATAWSPPASLHGEPIPCSGSATTQTPCKAPPPSQLRSLLTLGLPIYPPLEPGQEELRNFSSTPT